MRFTGALLLLASCTNAVMGQSPPDVVIEPSADVVDASRAAPDRGVVDAPPPPDVLAPVDVGGALPCTAGRIEECPCGDGRRGTQTCQPSGMYGPCVCADSGASADLGAATDALAMDVGAPIDAGAPTDAGASRPDVPPTNPLCPTTTVAVVTGCYTEEGCDSLCPRGRFVGRAAAPSWRVTGIVISQPAALASPLILNVLNPPLRDGRFLRA